MWTVVYVCQMLDSQPEAFVMLRRYNFGKQVSVLPSLEYFLHKYKCMFTNVQYGLVCGI